MLAARLRDLHRRLRGALDVADDVKAAVAPLIDAAGDVLARDWRCFNEDYTYWYAQSPAPPVPPLFPSLPSPLPSPSSAPDLTSEDGDDARRELQSRLSANSPNGIRPSARQRGAVRQLASKGVIISLDAEKTVQATSSGRFAHNSDEGHRRFDVRALVASFTPSMEASKRKISRLLLPSHQLHSRLGEDGQGAALPPWWGSLPQSLLAQATAAGGQRRGHGRLAVPFARFGAKPLVAIRGH